MISATGARSSSCQAGRLKGSTVGANLAPTAETSGTIREQYQSANRKRWINRIISKTVELIATARQQLENKEQITRLQVELELLLNPSSEDSAIQKQKQALIAELEHMEDTEACLENSIRTMLDLTKEVLAHEWELIKQNQ